MTLTSLAVDVQSSSPKLAECRDVAAGGAADGRYSSLWNIRYRAPLLGFALITWLLHYFVALTSPPTQRAAWTVGIAYLILAAICMVALPLEYWWAAPLAPVLGAPIAFWWWRNDFGRDWIDDSQGIPQGVELANDDWRVGLIFVGIIFALFALRFVIRLIEQGLL